MVCRIPIEDNSFAFRAACRVPRERTNRASRSTQHSARSAFTLIELLTVIGIIAILAAIISIAVNVVSNNANSKRTRVAIENVMGMQQEYENATPLTAALKANVNASLATRGKLTVEAMLAFLRVPANKVSLSKLSNTSLGAPPVADWASGTAYVIGDVVKSGPAGFQCIQAHTAAVGNQAGTAGGTAYWAGPVAMPIDGWGQGLLYVGGSLTNVTRATVTAQTIVAPNGKPFWVSAGPDGDFVTHDDNVYSFEN